MRKKTLNRYVAFLGTLIVVSHACAAFAQQNLPPIPGQGAPAGQQQPVSSPTATTTNPRPPLLIDQSEAEVNSLAKGQYPDLNRNTSVTVGSLQRAWDIPRASSGQTSPGVIRYAWHPNLVMALRTREFMVTTIHLPEWERLTNLIIGDPVVFEAKQIKNNVFAIRPTNGGADTNITAIGVSGNVYSFYVRSEGWNSDNISDFTVYVDKGNDSMASSVSGRSAATGQIVDVLHASNTQGWQNPDEASYQDLGTPGNGIFKSNGDGSFGIAPPDYIREIAFRPESLRFDMRILVSDPTSAEIAPVRVFRDDVWTYFDFGSKADSVRRPIVYLVVDGVDSMVNTRTAGPTGNILIAEAVGDFTLRNGNQVVCIMREETYKRRQGDNFVSSYDPPPSEDTFENADNSGRIQERQRDSFAKP